jgi:hypothetical protein
MGITVAPTLTDFRTPLFTVRSSSLVLIPARSAASREDPRMKALVDAVDEVRLRCSIGARAGQGPSSWTEQSPTATFTSAAMLPIRLDYHEPPADSISGSRSFLGPAPRDDAYSRPEGPCRLGLESADRATPPKFAWLELRPHFGGR